MKKYKNSIIKLVSHPHPVEIMQARRDHAHLTGQPLMERAFWYEDLKTGFRYHDLFGCIGWPSQVADNSKGIPGYAAIVAVLRPKSLDKNSYYDARDAKFVLLCESETYDVPTLLRNCVKMRTKYGFGLHPDLLNVWRGDPERFYKPLALFNERLIEKGGDQAALLITPPEDFYTPMIFDNYVRSLESTIRGEEKRFYALNGGILKTRLNKFLQDDPAVLAVGGLIHTLLSYCAWMDDNEGGAFTVDY